MSDKATLLDYVYQRERQDPDRIVFTQPLGGGQTQTWTTAQVMRDARRMASYLKGLDMPERSQVAICSKNCVHWIIADLAIWMSGHVSVPVYPTLTAQTVRHILEHSESRLLFVGKLDACWQEMRSGVPEGMPRVRFPLAPEHETEGDSWDSIVETQAPLIDVVPRAAKEMATLIYTSGSTGLPKGVMQSFGAMLQCTIGINRVIDICPGDRYLSYLPISHAMERWLGECAPLYAGHHIFYAESLDTFVQDLQRARPTLFLSVPRLWLKFQRGVFEQMPPKKLRLLFKVPLLSGIVKKKILAKLGLDQVRFAGSGSAPISAELIDWYRQLGLELLEGYGMSENFNYSHLTKPGQVRAGYIGTPYDDVECRLSKAGEVLIKSPGSMMGYFKMPEESQASFTDDGFLHTGDRGELDSLGRLKITGRTKEIFKTSKGKYVAPAPIENQISNHPNVELCCVGGRGYPQPHAVIQLSDAARAEAQTGKRDGIIQALTAHLDHVNQKLETFERLQFVAVVEEQWAPENGFLTPTLKIRRGTIEDHYSPELNDWYEQGSKVVWHSHSQGGTA